MKIHLKYIRTKMDRFHHNKELKHLSHIVSSKPHINQLAFFVTINQLAFL